MAEVQQESKPSKRYEAGCHCGQIKFSFELSPPLPEYKVLECNCSICRRAGYLLVYPTYEKTTWYNDSKAKCSIYQFATKSKNQLFCGKCGASIGIDFYNAKPQRYGFSARTINDINLDTLKYEKLDGINEVGPKGDCSGQEHKEDASQHKDGTDKEKVQEKLEKLELGA